MARYHTVALSLSLALGTITLLVQGCKGAGTGERSTEALAPTTPALALGTAPLEVHAYVSGAMSDADLLVVTELEAVTDKLAELSVRTVVHVIPVEEQVGVTLEDTGAGPFAVVIEEPVPAGYLAGARPGVPRTVIQTPEGETRKSYEEASQGQAARMLADLERYLSEAPRPRRGRGGTAL